MKKVAVLSVLVATVIVTLIIRQHCQGEGHRLSTSFNSPPSELQSSVRKARSVSLQRKEDLPIRQLSLLGERNSGTRWTFDHLSTCFNHSLHVVHHLTRYKHWFQSPNSTRYSRRRQTLVVAQFRNPYDWLEAMRAHPHHAPVHLHVEWKEFLTKPWTMERIGLDLNVTDNNATVCQHGFRYNEINSCHAQPLPIEQYDNIHCSRHQPFYELQQDGSGEPFESILELRAQKIRNFLETRKYPNVTDTWLVQYEQLVNRGTKGLLDRISKVTGVNYTCNPYPVQTRRVRELSSDFVDHVSTHVDWEAEELIGYSRRRRRRT